MTKLVPAGVRVASALFWTAAGCGAFLVAAGFAADRRVAGRIPSLAGFTAYPGQNPADLVENIRDALWIQIALGVVAAVGCAIGAKWVSRPSGNARVAGFAVPVVVIPLMGLLLGGSAAAQVSALAAGTGKAGLAAAYHHLLPSGLSLATQCAEIGVIVSLVAGLLIIVRGRFSDYYQRGRVETNATFWASERQRNDQAGGLK